jgi:5-(carboxyamino)imidazole ribonucleotide mutase
MPAGVPVATVSIGGARNAGILAARILGAGSDGTADAMREKVVVFQADLKAAAVAKGAKLSGLS